jgi:dipeptide/tripeptide permease
MKKTATATKYNMNKLKNTWSLLSITFIERFAFYLFNGLCILYLISENRFPNEKAFSIFNTFKILIYSLPVIMGLISDFVNREKVFKIGLILSIVGYAIVPFFSFSYWTLNFALIILALGVTIVRPNIPVLIGDNASQTGNEKRIFRDFLLMGFLISLAPILVNGINNSFSGNDIKFGLFISSILILIAFLLNHFFAPKINRLQQYGRQNLKQNIFAIAAFFLIGYSIMVLINNVSPLLSIETEGSKITFQNINNFFSIPLFLILLALLAIKSIRIKISNTLLVLGITAIYFASIFMAINFQQISNFSFAADNIVLVIALIAIGETIFLPIFTMLIYKLSFRFKGFAFGLYYSSVAWISISFRKIDIGQIYLIIPIVFLVTLGIIIILMRKKIRTSVPNNL